MIFIILRQVNLGKDRLKSDFKQRLWIPLLKA